MCLLRFMDTFSAEGCGKQEEVKRYTGIAVDLVTRSPEQARELVEALRANGGRFGRVGIVIDHLVQVIPDEDQLRHLSEDYSGGRLPYVLEMCTMRQGDITLDYRG